jgi:hypothetical protein
MGEAGRNPELVPVCRRQLDGDMAAPGRRPGPNIYADVEDRSPRASHKLALRARRNLEVQAAKYTFLCGEGMIVLHKGRLHAVTREGIRVKGLGGIGRRAFGARVLFRIHLIGDDCGKAPPAGEAAFVRFGSD